MSNEALARNVGPSKLDIAYERGGAPEGPVVLLVMGLALQMIAWPDAFCDALAKRGLGWIRFDNRDAGRSTHFADKPPYTLTDMAADTVGLLDALDLKQVHVVGASMGGFIAQTIAIEHRDRLRSLTTIMSSTGARDVGQPDPAAMQALFSGPPAITREEVIQQRLRTARIVGSAGFGVNEAEMAERAGVGFDRGYDPKAIIRQAGAVMSSSDRTDALRNLDIPTLVIHGLADRLIDPSGGRAIAAAIPGADLWLIEGMGHDLPPDLRVPVADRIADHVWRAEKRSHSARGQATAG